MDTLTKHQLQQAEFLVSIAKNNTNSRLARHFSDHALLENLNIVTDFPHYDYWIEEDLRVLIFKI